MNSIGKLGLISGMLLAAAFFAGCSGDSPNGGAGQGHSHAAPHGGALVMLGNHLAQLELVAEENGNWALYTMDGGAERFIRVAQPGIAMKLDGRPTVFKAMASEATGETVGDTAKFGGQADWVDPGGHFEVVIDEIVIRGQSFSDVSFHYPEGKH